MHTTYAMDTCIETNKNRAFGTEVYSRFIRGICKDLEYFRRIPEIRLTYDTIRSPDVSTGRPSARRRHSLALSAQCPLRLSHCQ